MQIKFAAFGSIESKWTAEELQKGLNDSTIELHIRGGYAEFEYLGRSLGAEIVARACIGYKNFSVSD